MNQSFESHVSLILIIAEIRSYIKGFMTPNCPYSPMFSPSAENGTAISRLRRRVALRHFGMEKRSFTWYNKDKYDRSRDERERS